MRLLVTGASGFIGKHVVESLRAHRNVELIVTSSNAKSLDHLYRRDMITAIPFDIYKEYDRDFNVFEFFGKPDKVIHLAWKGLPNYAMPFHVEDNLHYDMRFLFNLIDNGLKDLTVTGTCFEYGMAEGMLSENMISSPANYYSLAKDTLRKALELYQHKSDFLLKWVRLFYTYGIGQHSNSIIPQLETAVKRGDPTFNMSGGLQLRDYLKVEEMALNIVATSLQNDITGIINNCSGRPIRILDFVNSYIESNRYSIGINPGYYPYSSHEPMEFWGDASKINRIMSNYLDEYQNTDL